MLRHSISNRKARGFGIAVVIALVATLLPGQGAIGSAAPLAQRGGMQKDVTYCTADGVQLKMDLYLPAGGALAPPAPAIIYAHGGSWRAGDKSEAELLAPGLVASGYVVASINYRLAPQYRWPAQIEDVKAALRWMRANAAGQADPRRETEKDTQSSTA